MTRDTNQQASSMRSSSRSQGLRNLLRPGGRWSKGRIAGLSALLALVVGAVLVVAPLAAACHPEITVSLNCAGKVTYTVSGDEDNADRNNPDVRVYDNDASHASGRERGRSTAATPGRSRAATRWR